MLAVYVCYMKATLIRVLSIKNVWKNTFDEESYYAVYGPLADHVILKSSSRDFKDLHMLLNLFLLSSTYHFLSSLSSIDLRQSKKGVSALRLRFDKVCTR